MVSPPVKFATLKLATYMYILCVLPKYNYSKVDGMVLEPFRLSPINNEGVGGIKPQVILDLM